MNKLLLFLVAILIAISVVCGTQAQERQNPVLSIYSADGNSVTNAHIVVGRINIPAGSPNAPVTIEAFPVTLSGAAAFSSADSYKCFGSEPVSSGRALFSGGHFKPIDGSHFVYQMGRSGAAWQQGYLCIGN